MQTETPPIPRPPFLSRPGLVLGVSVALMVALVTLLWAPWEGARTRGDRPLRLYCAAGIAKPVQELLRDFESETGVKVEASFGGSGEMLASISATEGRGDLFLCADALHIKEARKKDLIAEVLPLGTLYPVLVLSRESDDDLKRLGKPVTGLKDLLRDDVKVVLADPKRASIGQVSREVLKAHGLWNAIERDLGAAAPRVSTTGTVNLVATSVLEKKRTLGIVWAPNAEQFGLVVVPVKELASYAEPLQIAVLKKSAQPAAALKLARFLNARDRGQVVFAKHHYDVADKADAWEAEPTVNIDAGAMLKPALDPVIRRFQEREGVKINVAYAGCGTLVSKMKAAKRAAGEKPSAIPDAFFACEISFLEQVQGWFDAGTQIAENDVVLVVARGKEKEVAELADLAKSHLRIGLADPEKSALGKLTDNVLGDLDLKEAILDAERKHPITFQPEAHLLVNQVRVGALDAAIVYRSSVESTPGNKEHMTIVSADRPHAIARQPFAIAQDTRHRLLLERFRDMLLDADSREQFLSRGFRWKGGR